MNFERNIHPLDTTYRECGRIEFALLNRDEFYFIFLNFPLDNGSYNVTAAETPKRIEFATQCVKMGWQWEERISHSIIYTIVIYFRLLLFSSF